jgi:L-alanine-DL-glutamate epimerase-like enolase superfamily enzyme
VTEGGEHKALMHGALTLDADGMLSPPAAPGLGVTLNEDYLAETRIG